VESWGGASFTDHDAQFFPIYSGAHAGRWDSCQTCHATPGDFSSFTCFACHEHSEGAMVDRHREVGGFVYDSRACLSCHPRGRAED
jgi:DnaJ-class molecular chaperone